MKSRYALSGAGLLLAMAGPCGERGAAPSAPEAERATLNASQPANGPAVPGAAPSAAPKALESPPQARQQTPTTRAYMLTHYADTGALRRGLVAGKLADAQAAAAAVAADGWTPRLRGDYQPHLAAVREAARAIQQAPNSQQAARGLATLAGACATCHVKFAGPRGLTAPEQLSEAQDPTMVAHAVGVDRAWEGLILPSDPSWSSGMELLLDAPSLDSDVADVSAAARHLRTLAQRGRTADGEQRGEIFANLLLTCAGCHERLGVSAAQR